MSKTTVVIDDRLIAEALKVTNLRTKREVIEAGLRELVRKRNRELLRKDLGTFDIDLTLDQLKQKRAMD